MVGLNGCRLSLWNILIANLIVLVTFTSANPQSRRRGGGRGFGPNRSNANNNEMVFTVNNQPSVTVPLDELTHDTRFLYFPVFFDEGVETARVIRGPPNVGMFFLSPPGDAPVFASDTIYAPEASARYQGAKDELPERFGRCGYVAFFLFPLYMDPNHFIAALTLSSDESDPTPNFQIIILDFTRPEVRNLIVGDRWPSLTTIEKAALVHAPNQNTRVAIFNAQKTEYTYLTPQVQLLRQFEDAKYFAGGESPPPGPIVLPQQLAELDEME